MSINSILKKKSLGILVHPTCLPEGTYCGTFGEGAKEWIRILSENKITYWQFLPLTPTDSCGSPYSSPSSFALNPWVLDAKELIKQEFISSSSFNEKNFEARELDYFEFKIADQLVKNIGEFLFNAWSVQSDERKKEFNMWREKNNWLIDFSIFMVLREEFNFLPWWEWPLEFKEKKTDSLNKWIEKNKKEILIKQLIQWHLDKQWKSIKDYAKLKGIKLIGDLPFYVSRDSADVWSNKSLFSISKKGDLIFQSGVPPDYFSSTGQLWGTPVYYWARHKRTRFDWWKKRFKRQFELVDILRLDHFRALSGFWRIDGNAKTAINGKWIKSPGNELLACLKKDYKSDYLPIIAEDLGLITEEVTQMRDNFKLPGMKILQFAFDGNDNNPYLPKNIKGENWIVYTGTHDNATTISWWESLTDYVRDDLKRNFNFSNNPAWDLIEIGMKTNAQLFIAPIQDILSLNDSCRLNTPGTTENNWKWKLNKPLLEIHELIKKYSRLGIITERIDN